LDPRLQRRVQRYGWDKAMPFYEQYWQQQIQPAQDKLLEMAALQASENVLDTACGTGRVSFPAAAAVGPGGLVVGTDISEKMVQSARAEARNRGVGNVRFERMEVEDLRFPDASFDAALCSLGLMYVPDVPCALQELYRVLKPGGRAVSGVWGARKNCGWAEIFPIVDCRVKSEVCPMFFQLGTAENQAAAFAAAGFADVQTERLQTVLRYASADEACGAAFAGGPVALAYSRFDPPTRAEAHAEYLASIAAFQKGEGYEIPGEFVVTRGRRA